MNKSYDVFLSYSNTDREFVTRLAHDLSKAGLNVWLDQWSLTPGETLAEAINEALKASHVQVVVMSPDYFQSEWTRQEWHYALGREVEIGSVKLVPIMYRDCLVPSMLQSKVWLDFRDPNRYQDSLARLVPSLYQLTNKATPVANQPLASAGPKPGERLEALDPATLSELRAELKNAVEAFRAQPTAQSLNVAATGTEDEDLCFIVMPFSVEALNVVYKDYVLPTLVDRCQLRSERGDDVFGSAVIMDDITRSIRKARLIIADLTGRNPNVFYEVGIAHALNKQVLLMTQSIEDVPFDLRHRRALVYEYSPRGCKKLEKDLYENVQHMLSHRTAG